LVAERYDVREEIGRGGMGVVHRASDRVLGRDVAIKLLAVDAPAARFADLLRREFALLARLEHPGIVPIYDAGVLDDGRVFYVMRLVEGQRLDVYAPSGVARGELLRVVLLIADAVAFANARGIAHCDLKPANVIVGSHGAVVVLDWGIARFVAAVAEPDNLGATLVDRVSGTPGYMAPEVRTAPSLASERVDVYSLGVITRELLALHGQAVPKPLQAIVTKAIALDPAQRYASVAEMAADLRRWFDGDRVEAHREDLLERTGRIVRRHQTAILLVGAYILIRMAIFFWRGI